MDAGPNAPPRDHLLVTGENAEAYLLANLLSGKAANRLKPTNLGINSSQLGSSFAARGRRNAQLLSAQRSQCAALKWSRLTAQTISVLRYMIARFSRMSGPIAPARIEC
jgi:hypothetical protein